jgi:peptidoglycan/LPS O-acetylase OafA/YrhL
MSIGRQGKNMKKKQVLLTGFLGVLGLAMLVGVAAIAMPKRYIEEEVIFTIITVGLFALGGLIVLAVSREMRITTRIALFAGSLSLVGFITLLWFERQMPNHIENLSFKLTFSFLIIALVCTHRLLIVPLEERNTWGKVSKYGALIGSILTGSFIILAMFLEEYMWNWDDLLIRLLGLGLLITAGSSISAGAIALFGPKPGEDEPDIVADSVPVQLCCPICSSQLLAHSNRAGHCGHCKLQIEVRTEELRCTCGYLLHQLEADICPECGKHVEAGESWRSA